MSSIHGPLLSFDAAGTFGGHFVYQKRRSGHCIYVKGRDNKSNTANQQVQRQYFAEGVHYWHTMIGLYQAQWREFIN